MPDWMRMVIAVYMVIGWAMHTIGAIISMAEGKRDEGNSGAISLLFLIVATMVVWP